MNLVRIQPGSVEQAPQRPAASTTTTPATRTNEAQRLAEALSALAASSGMQKHEVEALVDLRLQDHVGPLDEARVREIAAEVAREHVSRVQVVTTTGKDGPEIAGAHAYLQVALHVTGASIPLLLVGSKGTGKTTLAEQLARALELGFATVNCSGAMTPGKLVGFPSPISGQWLKGELTRHLEAPTLVLVDELDAADPGVQLCMNSILANRYVGEPTGNVQCHEKFAMVMAANTVYGATREYNGREKLDGALLDRCAVLELPMDNAVEASLAGVTEASTLNGNPNRGGLYKSGAEWLADVRVARAALLAKGLTQFAPSPRAVKDGATLHTRLGRHWLRELFLYRAAQPDVRNIIEAELNKTY